MKTMCFLKTLTPVRYMKNYHNPEFRSFGECRPSRHNNILHTCKMVNNYVCGIAIILFVKIITDHPDAILF